MRVREYNVNENKVGLSIEDGINLASAQFKEDAYEIYKESRKQPILFVNQVEIGKEWLITRYEDALPLLKDNRLKRLDKCVFSRYKEHVSFR